jgi:hypothetical protein
MKRERKKLTCGPRDIINVSWASFFVCQREVWDPPSPHFGHPGGVLGLPCAFSLLFAPSLMFTPIAAVLCRLVAVACSGGAARLGAGFLQWIGDGEGEGAYLALSRCSGLPASHFIIPK